MGWLKARGKGGGAVGGRKKGRGHSPQLDQSISRVSRTASEQQTNVEPLATSESVSTMRALARTLTKSKPGFHSSCTGTAPTNASSVRSSHRLTLSTASFLPSPLGHLCNHPFTSPEPSLYLQTSSPHHLRPSFPHAQARVPRGKLRRRRRNHVLQQEWN